MGSTELASKYTSYVLYSTCLHAAKVAKLREKPNPDPQELDFSFQLDVFIDSCARGTMPNELVLALLFIWPQLWSILLLKFLNSLVMLLVTIRKPGSFRDISNWRSEMMRNLTNSWLE